MPRVDARRNYERILAAASAEVAATGADASLEKIARDAGVGSATLHRHFPTRQALLEAVFHDRVAVLCEQARDQTLTDWLRAVADYGATTRGLAAALLMTSQASSTCEVMLTDAGGTLLRQAQAAGEVRADIAITDLLTMVNAVSLATQDGAEAVRLVTLALEGIAPAAH
ncbi:TetR/AcrR family transcriptional regulator [Actinoplanes sp. G11-F43]|uniref:TetR/AcrR family transcriptional regulator n=1 Tax=Actinoplanes sp. G11-F43 TaxID=3424130 RepID=UPI003D3462BF